MIDRNLLKTLRDEINAALESVANKHGIAIRTGSCTFTSRNATFKLEVAAKDESGTVQTKERTDWALYAPLFQIDPSKLDSTIHYFGHTYKIVGLLPKSRRCPVVAERQPDGRRFKLPTDCLK